MSCHFCWYQDLVDFSNCWATFEKLFLTHEYLPSLFIIIIILHWLDDMKSIQPVRNTAITVFKRSSGDNLE